MFLPPLPRAARAECSAGGVLICICCVCRRHSPAAALRLWRVCELLILIRAEGRRSPGGASSMRTPGGKSEHRKATCRVQHAGAPGPSRRRRKVSQKIETAGRRAIQRDGRQG